MKILIIGGAGFIGCNAARYFIHRGDDVVVVDNLSRNGSQSNLDWLRAKGPSQFIKADIRDHDAMVHVFREHGDVDAIIHLAAQVAVTSSVTHPREDFEINALGTFNVLEAIRALGLDPVFLYASTNKVYGGIEDATVVDRDGRYEYENLPDGIDESRNLDFHSPYGCSKGAADQYVRDYHRIYGMRTVVFRQSCIYGYRQFGVEKQGWIAWFTIASALGKPITIYGDGKQTRDVLFIDDLVDAFDRAIRRIDTCKGGIYNIGGSNVNQLSLHELITILEKLIGRKIEVGYADWRPGDQKVFICNTAKAQAELGWAPKIGPAEGIERLYRWTIDNIELFT